MPIASPGGTISDTPLQLPDGLDITHFDNSDLVKLLDIDGPTDNTKLLDDCVNYTDLLPPAYTAPQTTLQTTNYNNYFDAHVLDTDSVPYTQPQPLTLNLDQDLNFIGRFVTQSQIPAAETTRVLVSDGTSQASTLPPLSPPEETFAPETKPRRRQQQQQGDAPKAKPTRKRRPRKPKVYEREDPFEDLAAEKRRLNAINAKKNRDCKKKMLEELDEKVKAVTQERDKLEQEVQELRDKEQQLRNELVSRFGVTLPFI